MSVKYGEGVAWRDGNAAGRDNNDTNDDDATFASRSGLERSLEYANLGFADVFVDVFADGRTSFCSHTDFNGFGPKLEEHVTIALRQPQENPGHAKEHGTGRDKDKPEKPGDVVGGSPNPEPASLLLIATGIGGLFLYRRQLLA